MPLAAVSLKSRREIDAFLQKLHELGHINCEAMNASADNTSHLASRLLVAGNGNTYLLDDILALKEEELLQDEAKQIFILTQEGERKSLDDIRQYYRIQKTYTPINCPLLTFTAERIQTMSTSEMEALETLEFEYGAVKLSLSALKKKLWDDTPVLNLPLSNALLQIHPKERRLNLNEILCGVTQIDPVVCPVINVYEQTFEPENIERWLRQKRSCPTTGKVLTLDKIVPNNALRELLWVDYKQKFKVNPNQDLCEHVRETLVNREKRLKTEHESFSTEEKQCAAIIEKGFKGKSLGDVTNMEKDLEHQRTSISNICSNLGHIFSGLKTLGFWGGLFGLCFLAQLIATPPVGIVVGSVVVGVFLSGVIGSQILRKYEEKKLTEIDNRLITVRRVKTHLENNNGYRLNLNDRNNEIARINGFLGEIAINPAGTPPSKVVRAPRPQPEKPLLYKNISTVFQTGATGQPTPSAPINRRSMGPG